YVLKITGLYRQYSMHAAGIVLSDVNLYDIIPIQYGNNDLELSQYTSEYLESIGIMKMDLLGLSNLTLLQNILDLIKLQENEVIDLNNINLNDEHVYNALSNGDTFGIFQFESPGMTKLLMRVLPTNLEDLSMTSAMYRPGPQSQIND
ncbi:DNA polymerase III subunit alpha, partial [bacterium]|nr:DNA polymerase III subunit alpha [bacterium]